MPRALIVIILAVSLAPGLQLRGAPSESPVEFNRDIRPILADHCFQCHGPDQARRKAELRLDTEDGARKVLRADNGGVQELLRRVTAESPDERMPPASLKRPLSKPQIELLKRWVQAGAPWQQHWAFIPPKRTPPTPTADGSARNPLDTFIADRLKQEGLHLSVEADRNTLIRRVTLDLTGLPPTPSEVDGFVADQSPDAYERVVDRLLASPRFGERFAFRWLDAARYADTNGYQSDAERFMWRWRDWVIEAFNQNQPFDQFTVEQLAGDLLPNATLDQHLATGFNRNHRGNGEGGVIPEEYAVEYVVDRVETTATVWMGLTLGCARCHSHKYDPFTQKEFYQLYAFFNNIPERGRANKYGNSPPLMSTPTRDQAAKLESLIRKAEAASRAMKDLEPEIDKAQRRWEASLPGTPPIHWSWPHDLLAEFSFEADAKVQPAQRAAGQVGQAAVFDGTAALEAGDVGDFGFYDAFTISAWIKPEAKDGTIVSRMVDQPESDGWALSLRDGRLHFHLTKRWLDDALRVESRGDWPLNEWRHVMVTYDGSREARGVHLFVDGIGVRTRTLLDELNQPFQAKEPLRIGGGGGPKARFRGLIDEVRLYRRGFEGGETDILANPETMQAIAAISPDQRTSDQKLKLRCYFLEDYAPEPQRLAYRRDREAHHAFEDFAKSIPTTMVMEELPSPKPAHVLIRGQYDKPGERVERGVPTVLPALGGRAQGADAPRSVNRLDLAKWLVRRDHPLTGRVTVNRFWQMLFGVGIVKTTEDFGTQGEWPSHPELLDWLAVDFVADGWDVKRLLRTIVTSSTYRQASRVAPGLLQRDPGNRLLARGPRLRLPAETVRDQALAASGLLVERLGGPSVKPYQPAGLWKELTGTEEYVADTGDKLYRRSLYTFWKRTAAPPQMATFDAAGRETCVVRETRTNTPLQALNLLNDVTFVEAARVLAQRAMREACAKPEDRVSLAFKLVTARAPRDAELRILLAGYHTHLADYRRNADAASKLLATGQFPRALGLDPAELAALTTVCSTILNLDETVNKE